MLTLVLATGTSCRKRADTKDALYASVPGTQRMVTIIPGLIIPFCWIPPGELVRPGFPEYSGEPSRDIRVQEGFWISAHEVTYDVWCKVMGKNVTSVAQDLPVSEVSWWDCCNFIAKLAKPGGHWRFDLPTESEWEYACRAGSTDEFYDNPLRIGWLEGNSDGGSHPVGLLAPNAWGLHDMHGNVAEWCADKCQEESAHRIIRGGSWASDWNAQASAHNCDVPSLRINQVGFRLVIRADAR